MAKGPGWSYSSLGADVSGLNVSAKGIRAEELRQSVAMGKVTDTMRGMWTNYLMAEGVKFLAGKYYDMKGGEMNAQTSVQLENLRNAKSAADANTALETLKITTAAEAL